MANVIGLPMIKGNSQELIVAQFDFSGAFEGMAVAWDSTDTAANSNKVVKLDDSNAARFAGFILDINPYSKRASMLRKADLVSLPVTESESWDSGDQVSIDPATGLIAKNGTILIDAFIRLTNVDAVNGKTGEKAAAAAAIEMHSTAQSPVAAP